MNDQGQCGLPRQADELRENSALNFARRMVVKVVQAGFADGNNLGVGGQLFDFLQFLFADIFGIVGMHTDGSIETSPRLSEGNRGDIARHVPGATDDYNLLYARFTGALNNRRSFTGVLLTLNMCVAID